MSVVGLDLSLTCSGVSVVDGVSAWTWQVKTSPVPGFVESWRRIRSGASRVIRLVPAPCLVVVEWASYGSRFGAADERSAHRWMVAGSLAELGCEVVMVAPKTRAKYATGDGTADKKRVLASMRARHPGVAIPDDNVADSLALAAMGARWLGEPIDGDPSRQQQQAMSAVRWPMSRGARA